MGKNLKPVWGGISNVIAYLYALLLAMRLYASEPNTDHGLGLIMMWVMLPIVFLIVLGLLSAVLSRLLGWVKDDGTRSTIAVIALGGFFVIHGVPSLFVLFFAVIAYFIGYVYCDRLQTDEHDLNKFMEK